MKNKDIRQFEDAIIDLCNNYDLPCEVKRLALKSVLGLITRECDKAILLEIQEEKEEENAESTH